MNTIHEEAPAYFPPAGQQAKQATEHLKADIMQAVLNHRNHDPRAVGAFAAAVEHALQRHQHKLDLLGDQGALVSGLKVELSAIANRAIAKARADGNVFAFEAAA
ncbi:hypothetical protein [Bradyrhizobium sp. AUGA SZCCT0182]|uniref:hypothetical protein n=1 Tax=Bradyrhizobium sp. AUGA SZCCT0182 TaxID=2807667 RepID=UPI001BABDEFC|nr:hypothetical protein [Bradyrhizobium sp. AUGA SZCCT0182]MBR1238176.1 hypothetical protein [Bradyrhizobium sp. AUGA SZCCT0182]